MPDFLTLDSALRRSSQLVACVCAALLAVGIAAIGLSAYTVWKARQAAAVMPVLVVPGAIAGVYAPGVTEENVRGVARYLAGLGTNFNGVASMDERFDELELFASPQYLPRLQQARRVLRRDVETQGQARVFLASPGHDALRQVAPGRFEYTQAGRRIVYASGLPMDARDSILTLGLRLTTSSRKNPLGALLERFEVADLAPTNETAPPAYPRPAR
jgi:hypothetical protein